ncbi:MAG: hypothetical protein GF329_03620 [Candidatus Lokiarchaeota archaeon]|nr:hypothetical protein [Candidatus Lokiarchaeota archaeon]
MDNKENGLSGERNYSYNIMDIQMELSSAQNKKVKERKRFELISKLVNDLFKYKERKGCYDTISSLIISTLISSEENCPIDIYNADDELFEDMDYECKKVLESELFRFSNELPN